MVTLPATLTLDEFLRLPEAEPSLEYEDGRVSQKGSPKGKHGALQFEIARLFDLAARPQNLARVFTEVRVTFAGVSRVPDLSLYRRGRIPLDASGEIADDFFTPPDLVVEIVSPKQRVNTLIRRCLWYVGHGVRVAVLVDPGDESIVLFRPNQLPRALREADRIDLEDFLPGFDHSAEELFAVLRGG